MPFDSAADSPADPAADPSADAAPDSSADLPAESAADAGSGAPAEADSPAEPPEFDSAHFRSVLGHFPTGVTVVTGLAEGRPAGFTIGSFTSISLEPPLVGFFPMTASDTWAAMAPYGNFCVNVLRDQQADLCWRFAKSGIDDGRFDGLSWRASPTGCPIIEGVGAWIDCRISESIELGDHYLVVGAVVALDHHVDTHVPLVFYKGALGGFSSAN